MRISDWSSDVCSSDLAVGCVGHHRLQHQGGTPLIVKGVHPVAVAGEGLRRRHVLDAHARPEAVRVAEGIEAGLLGDSRPGENDDASAFHTCPTALILREAAPWRAVRSEEHTSELQSLMRISYAVFCLKQKKK